MGWGEPDTHTPPQGLYELLRHIDRKVDNMTVSLTNLEAAVAALATAEAAAAEELAALAAEVANLNTGEAPSQEQIDAITSKITSVTDLLSAATTSAETPTPAPAPAPEPPEPTTEEVTVTIGESGEGWATIQHAPADVSIATQPADGTASIEPVEGQPDQASVKVVNSTPSTSQSVIISITAAA